MKRSRVFAVIFALWVSRVTESRVMVADSMDFTTRVVITKVAKVSIVVVAVFVALPIAGIDITASMLGRGHERVARAGAEDRVQLVRGQAEHLPFPDASFDALTFTYLLRYVNPAKERSCERLAHLGFVLID